MDEFEDDNNDDFDIDLDELNRLYQRDLRSRNTEYIIHKDTAGYIMFILNATFRRSSPRSTDRGPPIDTEEAKRVLRKHYEYINLRQQHTPKWFKTDGEIITNKDLKLTDKRMFDYNVLCSMFEYIVDPELLKYAITTLNIIPDTSIIPENIDNTIFDRIFSNLYRPPEVIDGIIELIQTILDNKPDIIRKHKNLQNQLIKLLSSLGSDFVDGKTYTTTNKDKIKSILKLLIDKKNKELIKNLESQIIFFEVNDRKYRFMKGILIELGYFKKDREEVSSKLLKSINTTTRKRHLPDDLKHIIGEYLSADEIINLSKDYRKREREMEDRKLYERLATMGMSKKPKGGKRRKTRKLRIKIIKSKK